MPDWSKSMQRTYEYYTVDPGTWKDDKRIDTVRKSSISRDSSVETLGSATIDIDNSLGESYVRIYLVTIQNGVKERHPLGTFLVQTPSSSFDGKVRAVSMDAYTPLLELKENPPPLGYSLLEGENIMEMAYRLIREHARAPVVRTECSDKLLYDFVANTNDTWLTFVSDLVGNAKYTLDLDELGRILFAPRQDIAALQPVWTYDDDNSSILYPEMTLDHDYYDVPNVVEVLYSRGNGYYYTRVVNDDPNSPVSTVSRGREKVHRATNPEMNGIPTDAQLDEYARQLLKTLSSVEYKISYSHGYCPVRVGDCVRLNYTSAGLTDVKAKVISQSIDCSPECKVSETAVFTKRLWGDD
jgi:hypothetical protein